MENRIYKAELRIIPEHLEYFKDYYIPDMQALHANMPAENPFQEISDLVLSENPGIRLTEPEYNTILYLDGEYGEKDVKFQFCDAVTGMGKNTSQYQFRSVPAFLALCISHRGPYGEMAPAFEFAADWMAANGYFQIGCPRTSAIDGYWNKDTEEEYHTEIQIPVRAIGQPLKLPECRVEKLFYLEAELHPDIHVGDVGRGYLLVCPIKGGFFFGDKLKGEILDFGADWNLMYANDLDIVDTRYLLKTHDGAIISLTTNGRCIQTRDQLALEEQGVFVDPETYYFRQHLFFETGSEKYQWLNGAIAFAILGCKPSGEVCYNAYMVL
jgi:hypothetical protein